MKRSISTIFSVMVISAAPLFAAEPDSDVEASVTVATHYSQAFVSGDCSKMEQLTVDVFRSKVGGPEKLRQFLCDFLQTLRDDGAVLSEEIVGPIGSFSDRGTRFVLVQKRRTSVRPDRRQISLQPYIVHTNDGGETWRVLDLGCADEKWLSLLAPTWKGKPPLPKMEFRVIRHGDS